MWDMIVSHFFTENSGTLRTLLAHLFNVLGSTTTERATRSATCQHWVIGTAHRSTLALCEPGISKLHHASIWASTVEPNLAVIFALPHWPSKISEWAGTRAKPLVTQLTPNKRRRS